MKSFESHSKNLPKQKVGGDGTPSDDALSMSSGRTLISDVKSPEESNSECRRDTKEESLKSELEFAGTSCHLLPKTMDDLLLHVKTRSQLRRCCEEVTLPPVPPTPAASNGSHSRPRQPSQRAPRPKSSSRKKKRRYDKVSYCLYCGQGQTKLLRHLVQNHKAQADVEELHGLTLGTKQRRDKVDELRRRGNQLHEENLANMGTIEPSAENQKVNMDESGPFEICEHCQAFLGINAMDEHLQNCPARLDSLASKNRNNDGNSFGETRNENGEQGSKMANVSDTASTVGESSSTSAMSFATPAVKKMLNRLHRDSVGMCVREDRLIVKFGSNLPSKRKAYKKVRDRMRELGRLLVNLRVQSSDDIVHLEDAIHPKHKDVLIESVLQAANYNPETQTFSNYSLASKIGQSLKSCTGILQEEALLKGEPLRKEELDSFVEIVIDNWSTLIREKTNVDCFHKTKRTFSDDNLGVCDYVISRLRNRSTEKESDEIVETTSKEKSQKSNGVPNEPEASTAKQSKVENSEMNKVENSEVDKACAMETDEACKIESENVCNMEVLPQEELKKENSEKKTPEVATVDSSQNSPNMEISDVNKEVSLQCSSTSETNTPTAVVNKRRRRMWSKEEIEAVRAHLRPFITKGKVPGKLACEWALTRAAGIIVGRTWRDVKNCVQGMVMRKKKK